MNKVERKWYKISAENKVLGRLSCLISEILQGKNEASFDPSKDMGGNVIVTNCEKVKLTGRKPELKKYIHHSGFIGGLKEKPFKDMLQEKPEFIIYHAVSKMLPKNKIRNVRLKRLKIYVGDDFPHKEQKIIEIK